jgi:hypothetical protein
MRLVGDLKNNSVNYFIKVYSYMFYQLIVSALIMSHLQVDYFFFTNSQYGSTIISLMTYNKN